MVTVRPARRASDFTVLTHTLSNLMATDRLGALALLTAVVVMSCGGARTEPVAAPPPSTAASATPVVAAPSPTAPLGMPVPLPTTAPSLAPVSIPPAPAPTAAVLTPTPSAPAGVARILGKISDLSYRRIAGALVTIKPFGVSGVTNAAGEVELLVPVGAPGCAWTTFEIRVQGYGSYTRFDEPLLAGVSYWDPAIAPGDVRQFVGAPLAEGDPVKPGFCPRGEWVAP
jgi:hypothetical protein